MAVAAGGIWQPKRIENLIHQARTGEALIEASNKFAKMAKGEATPDSVTIHEFVSLYPACDARFWLDHPLFYLLDDQQDGDAAIRYALDRLRGPLRMELWSTPIDYASGTGSVLKVLDGAALMRLLRGPLQDHLDSLEELDHHRFVTRKAVQGGVEQRIPLDMSSISSRYGDCVDIAQAREALGPLTHLEVFTLLVALAKMALRQGESDVFSEAARISWGLYPSMVAHSPSLLYSVESLATLLGAVLWRPHNELMPMSLQVLLDPAWHGDKAFETAGLLGLDSPPRHYAR